MLRPTGFTSERLVYRAPSFPDDEPVFAEFLRDPTVLLGAVPSTCKPLNKKDLDGFKKASEEASPGLACARSPPPRFPLPELTSARTRSSQGPRLPAALARGANTRRRAGRLAVPRSRWRFRRGSPQRQLRPLLQRKAQRASLVPLDRRKKPSTSS